jgi:hypothetical protein
MATCDFKMHKKEKKRNDTMSCIRHTCICTPETYYNSEFQQFVADNRRQNQWIFDLMTVPDCPGEKIYHNAGEWILARDLHRGTDNRYLIVFKDTNLNSIRDLRSRHVCMLKRLVAFLKKWLPTQEPAMHDKYHMYFHYMPSVFQLHMHVSMRKAPDSIRIQNVSHVLRNLRQSDTWYRDALILCQNNTVCKYRPSDTNKMS